MRLATFTLGALLLSLPVAASAEDAKHEPSAADIHTTRVALTEGLALREKGEHLAALGRLQTAYDLLPTPITAFELGKTRMILGHVLQAYELFRRVAAMEVRPDESERAKTSRLEAARLATELEPRVPSLKIKLRLPEGASAVVRLDDETIAIKGSEMVRSVDPGTHRVVAKAGDGPEQSVSVTVKESESKDVELAPQWVKPEPKPEPGKGALYTRHTNPLTFLGFTFAAAGVVHTVFSLTFLSSATSALADKCANEYCPPSTAKDERPTSDLWLAMTVAGFAATAVGLAVGIYGFTHPIRERVTVGVGPGTLNASITF